MPSESKFNIKLTFMKWIDLFVLERPLRVPVKQNAGAAAAAGDIIGGVLGLAGTSMTNDNNLRIARATREWQSKENDKQRAWQVEQWQREQEYNTPENQMKRYSEAGINPFLMADSGSVESGQTKAPSSPAPVGAPNVIPMRSPDFGFIGQGIRDAVALEANVGNQQAQMVKTYVEAANEAYRNGNKDLGDKILDIGLIQYGTNANEVSLIKEQVQADVVRQRLSNDYQRFINGLQQKYGDSEAQAKLRVLQQQYDKVSKDMSVADASIELMRLEGSYKAASSARERSEIRVNMARIKELLSSAYEKFQNGNYLQSKGFTEDEIRQFYVRSVQLKALDDEMIYQSSKAEFEGESDYRAWLASVEGKKQIESEKTWQYNPWNKYTRRFGQVTNNVLSGIPLPRFIIPLGKFKTSSVPSSSSSARSNYWQNDYEGLLNGASSSSNWRFR